jgi:hypothetical protein
MKTNDSLRDAWRSLGIAFHHPTKIKSDPESALIELVRAKEFPEDKKMLGLALLWLSHYSNLVHIERLKTLAKDLLPLELAVLGAIASKCVKNGDHRWKTLTKMANEKNQGQQFEQGDSETFIKMRGLDKEFAQFGVNVAPTLPDDEKKLRPRHEILKHNDWLKSRVLFGTNMRADIATVISLNLAQTAYAAAKLLRCAPNTAYRNWNDLEEGGWPTLHREK